MDSLYNRIVALCNIRGITSGKMSSELDVSRGMMTDLKMGRKKTLSAETITKIADYFSVSVDFLLGVENVLRKQRRDNLLSLDEMSNETGIPEQTIVDWEIGVSAPNDEQVKQLAQYFKIPEEYIRNHKGSPDDGLDKKATSIDNAALLEAIRNKKASSVMSTEDAVRIIAMNAFGPNPTQENLRDLDLAVNLVIERAKKESKQ